MQSKWMLAKKNGRVNKKDTLNSVLIESDFFGDEALEFVGWVISIRLRDTYGFRF
jgi:hypothetical protein